MVNMPVTYMCVQNLGQDRERSAHLLPDSGRTCCRHAQETLAPNPKLCGEPWREGAGDPQASKTGMLGSGAGGRSQISKRQSPRKQNGLLWDEVNSSSLGVYKQECAGSHEAVLSLGQRLDCTIPKGLSGSLRTRRQPLSHTHTGCSRASLPASLSLRLDRGKRVSR